MSTTLAGENYILNTKDIKNENEVLFRMLLPVEVHGHSFCGRTHSSRQVQSTHGSAFLISSHDGNFRKFVTESTMNKGAVMRRTAAFLLRQSKFP
jgi:hypothetical protein